MDRHLRPVRAAHVHWRALEDGGVLVRLADQRRFTVDEIGLVLWDRCNGMHSVEDLVDVIVHLFEVGADRAAHDVAGFLDHLEREDLIHLCEGTPDATRPRPASRPAEQEVLI